MRYQVSCQYQRGPARVIAEFDDPKNATIFIDAKLAEDRLAGEKITYLLVELGEVLKTYDQSTLSAPSTPQSTDAQGQSSGATSRPTPFNTSPRPAGIPPKWVTGSDDDEKKR